MLLLHEIARSGTLAGVDVVEVNPYLDHLHRPIRVGIFEIERELLSRRTAVEPVSRVVFEPAKCGGSQLFVLRTSRAVGNDCRALVNSDVLGF